MKQTCCVGFLKGSQAFTLTQQYHAVLHLLFFYLKQASVDYFVLLMLTLFLRKQSPFLFAMAMNVFSFIYLQNKLYIMQRLQVNICYLNKYQKSMHFFPFKEFYIYLWEKYVNFPHCPVQVNQNDIVRFIYSYDMKHFETFQLI